MKPAKLVIETGKTESEDSYSWYFYQLENSKGKALTGKGEVAPLFQTVFGAWISGTLRVKPLA